MTAIRLAACKNQAMGVATRNGAICRTRMSEAAAADMARRIGLALLDLAAGETRRVL